MSVRRYYPTQDTSVANHDYWSVGQKDISDSNVGASEILNLYRTVELSGAAKVLIDWNDTIAVPVGAEVWMKLFDAQHADTLPYGYDVVIRPIEQAWEEGAGHDLDYYTDTGVASWNSATLTSSWVPMVGLDSTTFHFSDGHEDLEVQLSGAMTASSFGYQIEVDPAITGSDVYIKKFHSRQTHFPEKRPYLEVRAEDWTESLTTSSFFVPSAGPWSGTMLDAAYVPPLLSGTTVSAPVAAVDPTGVLNAVLWPMRRVFGASEQVVFHLQVRPQEWNPPTVATASSDATGCPLRDCYYRVVDDTTGGELVPFGTGTVKYTKLSYDDMGNFFTFRMDTLPPGKVCRFDFGYNLSGSWTVLRGDGFKFRVE